MEIPSYKGRRKAPKGEQPTEPVVGELETYRKFGMYQRSLGKPSVSYKGSRKMPHLFSSATVGQKWCQIRKLFILNKVTFLVFSGVEHYREMLRHNKVKCGQT
jgi:hypothetical protein